MCRESLAAFLACADPHEAARNPLEVEREVLAAHVREAERHDGGVAEHGRLRPDAPTAAALGGFTMGGVPRCTVARAVSRYDVGNGFGDAALPRSPIAARVSGVVARSVPVSTARSGMMFDAVPE